MTINIHSLIHHIFSRTHKQHMDGKSMYIGKIGSWDVKICQLIGREVGVKQQVFTYRGNL